MRLPLLMLVLLPSLAARGEETEIVVVANPSLPTTVMERAELEMIFTSRERTLKNDQPVVAFNLAPEDPARLLFERVVLQMTPEQVSRFWVDQRIRGSSTPLRQVADQDLVVRLVAKLPSGIGYVSAATAAKAQGQIRIVARISNGKVLAP